MADSDEIRWLKWAINLDFPAPLSRQRQLAITRLREVVTQLEEIPDEVFAKLLADLPNGGMCGKSFFADDPERKIRPGTFALEEGWKAIWSVQERPE